MTAATKSQGTPAPNNTGAGGPVTVKRTLSVFDLVVFGMIFMVPIAPFSILASVANTSHGMPALAYVIAMVAMLFTAFSFDLMVPATRRAAASSSTLPMRSMARWDSWSVGSCCCST